jgi:hypothetical protein
MLMADAWVWTPGGKRLASHLGKHVGSFTSAILCQYSSRESIIGALSAPEMDEPSVL